jgi:hypothetical protein
VVVVPTASPEVCDALRAEVDEVVCAITPEPFEAVGRWYEDFSQTTDDEVRDLLARRQQPEEQQAEPSTTATTLIEAVRAGARPLFGAAQDYDPLMDLVGDARFALLGEASHGTHEFYRERARITRRLIEEKGFVAVAVAADWPLRARPERRRRCRRSAQRLPPLPDLDVAQHRGRRVPRVAAGAQRRAGAGCAQSGFYGLDLYSLRASMKGRRASRRRRPPSACRRPPLWSGAWRPPCKEEAAPMDDPRDRKA